MRAAGILWKGFLAAWVVAALAVLLAYRSFSMPSSSMVPTLRPGDYFVVSTAAYDVSKYSLPFHPDLFSGRLFGRSPQRGDVVVFALPRDTKTSYVKRVIGLSGDTIQMKEGRLFINGKVVPRDPVAKVQTEDFYGRNTEVPTYKETLPGGASYTIIEIQGDAGFNDNTEAFKVPDGSYFTLGDNRDNSTDSRVPPDQGGVGFVPFENLIGRVELVFLSMPKGEGTNVPLRRVH